MSSFDDFKAELERLVKKVPEVEGQLKRILPGKAGHGKPEDATKEKLLTPLLEALGFDADHRTHEASMRRSGVGRLVWVDYVLKKTPDDHKGLALLEAKSLLEEDLWKKHQKQIRGYLHDYQMALPEREDPVRWIVLTNFREMYILNIADYEPFFKLTYQQYIENAPLLFRLLNREQLNNDQITSVYYEKRHVPLGKSFLNDLKLWRLLLANGFKQSQPDLTLEEVKGLSQQILNRIIFIRVLETYGLQRYYSLVRQYDNWKGRVRNTDQFPFFDNELLLTFKDIELDLNTDLFKDTLIQQVCARLSDVLGHEVARITIPNTYVRPLVDPDVYWPEKDHELRELIGFQTGQQSFALSTPYNYDFHTLNQDIIGRVYEQFLAHNLVQEGDRILIRTDQTLRQQEGAYYTPTYVVLYLIEGTLGLVARQILETAKIHLQDRQYDKAQLAISQLKTIKVIDLACGSGSFLISAYDFLLSIYKQWNELLDTAIEKDFKSNLLRFFESGLQKEDSAGDSILRHNIFGVDRDAQAIREAQLNMWQLLLRAQPDDYMRIGEEPPKRKLPDLSKNFVVADSLASTFNIDAFLGIEPQKRVFLGNPPWGAEVMLDKLSLNAFSLAKGQYDSYDLFMERITQYLRPGDLFGYIVPDSILQLPQHAPLRELILKNYQIESLVKLGEGVFEDVFRAAVAFIFTRSNNRSAAHTLRSRIIVKAERDQLLKISRRNSIQDLLDREGISITQIRFDTNKEKVFDIFVSDDDVRILEAIDSNTLKWQDVTTTGRGVELSKNGLVMACPHCGIWRPIPHKQRNGSYKAVQCLNPTCGKIIRYENAPGEKIVMPGRTLHCTQPIIVGEGINRYQVVETRFIDTSKVRTFPRCPNSSPRNPKFRCSFCDFTAPPFVPGETRICKQCGQKYSEKDVVDWVNLGINYKIPGLFEGEKLLVRKTGRGIYATIERTGAYTNQVVFIFKLRSDRPERYEKLRLSYILGVLNSRMMLYRYYKALGDIEWKSFPYMTQKTIMDLPVRDIDFTDVRQTYFHDQIAGLVDAVISSGIAPNQSTDNEIERLVRELYGVNTPIANARIDSELNKISLLGSLLGSSTEEPDDDEQ